MKLVIAHYGRQPPKDPVAAFADWCGWIAEHMGAETHLTANFSRSGCGLKEGEAYDSKKHRATIDAELDRGNVTQLTLTSMASRPKGYIAFEYDWTAVLDVTTGRFGPIGVLVLDAEGQQSNLSTDALLEAYGFLARRMIDSGYGFATVMPHDFMPVGYAIGLACGGAPEKFVYDANAWRRYARKECDESLRNVFGYNLLNDTHLDIGVGDESLDEWVSASPERGEIRAMGRGLHLWTFQGVDPGRYLQWDCPAVVAVREQLEARHLFPWQRLPGV